MSGRLCFGSNVAISSFHLGHSLVDSLSNVFIMFYLNDIWIFTEDSGQGHVDTYRIVKWPGPKSLIIFPRLQPDGLPPPITSNLEDLTVFKHWQVSHLPGRLMAAPKVGSVVAVRLEGFGGNWKSKRAKFQKIMIFAKVQSPKSKKKTRPSGSGFQTSEAKLHHFESWLLFHSY